MKKLKPFIAGSLVAVTLLSAPYASFAKDNKEYNEYEFEKSIKSEVNFNSSFFSKFNPFTRRANAATHINTNQAPVISNLVVTSDHPTKATISWNTDRKARSLVWYSTTSPVSTSENPKEWKSEKKTKHKVKLHKLTPNTTYYVIVGSVNKGGKTLSTQISFTTPAAPNTTTPPVTTADTTAPKIYNLRMETSTNTSTIRWTTDEPATSKVFYSKITPIDTGASSTLSVSSNSLVTEHSLTISGLMPDSIYGFIIKSADSKGNEQTFGEARFMTSRI